MRKLTTIALGVAAMAGWAAPAAARGTAIDCPLRDAPFSLDTPLIDIMLSPAAKDVLDRGMDGKLSKASGGMAARFFGTTPPTFSAVLSVREATGMMGVKADKLPAIDADLRKLPVTRADKEARCARYDVAPPQLAIPATGPRVLVFEKINGFRDGPSVDAARAALLALGQENGWHVVVTDKGSAFTPAILKKFDTVIWNNISGDVLTLRQRAAFQDYMEKGGGFVGIHGSAGDPVYFWDWYADTLLGARFKGHPMGPQFQDATIHTENHPIAAGLPSSWAANDEWYSFKNNPRDTGSRVVATLDEKTYKPQGMGGDLRMGDHPIAWTRCVGQGRMFYSAIGHRPERYSDALYRQMLTQGVNWAMGVGGKDCVTAK